MLLGFFLKRALIVLFSYASNIIFLDEEIMRITVIFINALFYFTWFDNLTVCLYVQLTN